MLESVSLFITRHYMLDQNQEDINKEVRKLDPLAAGDSFKAT